MKTYQFVYSYKGEVSVTAANEEEAFEKASEAAPEDAELTLEESDEASSED